MSFVRDAAGLLVTSIVLIPLGLATSIVLARFLSVEDRGLYALLTSFALLVFAASELGWSTSVVYRIRRAGSGAARVFGTGLVANVALGLLCVGLCAVAREPLSRHFLEDAPALPFWLAVASVPCLLAGEVARGVARALDRFDLSNWFGFWQAVALLGGFVVWLVLRDGALLEATAVFFAANVALALWIVVAVARLLDRSPRADATELRESVGFGAKAWVNTVTLRVHDQLDLFVIAFLLASASEVAFYAVAAATLARLTIVPSSLAVALFPRLADAEERVAARFALFVTRHALWMAFAVAAILAPLSSFLIPLLYGAEYGASVVPFLLSLPGIAGLTASRLLGRWFLVLDRQGSLILARVAAIAVNLVLLALLVPSLGIAGAALAKLLSLSAEGAFVAAIFLRATGLRWRELVWPQAGDADPYRRRIAPLWRRARARLAGGRSDVS